MLIDLVLDAFSALMEALIAALPAFSFDATASRPGGMGNGSAAWHDLTSQLVQYNAFLPLRELFVLVGLFSAFLGVMLIVKFIMWVIEIFPGKMS